MCTGEATRTSESALSTNQETTAAPSQMKRVANTPEAKGAIINQSIIFPLPLLLPFSLGEGNHSRVAPLAGSPAASGAAAAGADGPAAAPSAAAGTVPAAASAVAAGSP